MHVPGAATLLYLAYVLVGLTWLAFSTRKRMKAARAAQPEGAALPIPRWLIYANTSVMLVVLLLLSMLTGRSFGFRVFDTSGLDARDWLIGAAALAAQFGLMLLSRALRSPEERRKLTLYRLIPRTAGEWALYVLMAALAGLAEEACYRGTLWAVLTWTLGNPWIAAAVSVAAFSIAHAMQGWKSGIVIALMAATFHAIVALTGTLVVAMIVHAVYDVVAGCVGAWRIRTGRVEG